MALTDKQKERLAKLFEEKILPALLENKNQILEKGKEAREFIDKKTKDKKH